MEKEEKRRKKKERGDEREIESYALRPEDHSHTLEINFEKITKKSLRLLHIT